MSARQTARGQAYARTELNAIQKKPERPRWEHGLSGCKVLSLYYDCLRVDLTVVAF